MYGQENPFMALSQTKCQTTTDPGVTGISADHYYTY